MGNILLIDDDMVLLTLYSTRLKADNHHVDIATNGEEGFEKLKAIRPDVIILDLLMPKLNGFSFIETIKNDPQSQHIPIIVFSSVANQEQVDRLSQLGIETYLNKTDVTPTQLVEVIKQYLPPPQSPPDPQT